MYCEESCSETVGYFIISFSLANALPGSSALETNGKDNNSPPGLPTLDSSRGEANHMHHVASPNQTYPFGILVRWPPTDQNEHIMVLKSGPESNTCFRPLVDLPRGYQRIGSISTHHVVMSQPELGPEGVQIVGFGHGSTFVYRLQASQWKTRRHAGAAKVHCPCRYFNTGAKAVLLSSPYKYPSVVIVESVPGSTTPSSKLPTQTRTTRAQNSNRRP